MVKKVIIIIITAAFAAGLISGMEFKRRERVVRGHQRAVTSVVFSPDSTLVLSTSFDRTLKIWKAGSGELVRTLTGHGDWVSTAAFSPDGKYIASAGHDRNVRIWRTETGQVVRILSGHSHYVSSAAFSSDGKSLYSVSPAAKTLLIHETNTGKIIRKLVFDKSGLLEIAVFSPDRKILAAGIGKHVHFFSTESGKAVSIFDKDKHIAGVKSIAFARDGKYMITGGGSTIDMLDGSIKIWETESGKLVKSIEAHESDVFIALTSDTRYIISASTDRTVKIWNFKTCTLEKKLQSDYEAFWCIAVSPDNRVMSAGTSESGFVVLWDTLSLGLY